LKKYQEIKDTKTPLIGSIPLPWRFMIIRRAITGHKQGFYSTDDYSDKGIKLLRISDLSETGNISYENAPYVNINEDTYKAYEVRKGDFLFPRTGSIGLIGYKEIETPSVFASYLIRFRFKKSISTNFLKYYLTSYPFKQELLSDLHGGVNQNIHAENIKNRNIILPSFEEQTQIAKYLDYNTSLINKLIEKNEKLIELLEEQRSAIISQAVTKGLNPDVKMKDSGIEWIGEIPEHWKIKALKHISEITLGKMLANEDKGGYQIKPYLRGANINWEKVNVDDVKEMWLSDNELKQYRLKENDLLVSEGGEAGRTCIWKSELDECYIQNSVHKVTINSKCNPTYYLYHFQTYGKGGYFNAIVNRVSIAHLTREKLKEVKFLYPPAEAQNTITNYLDYKTTQIDKLIEEKRKTNEYLKEYRTTLISNVVTGKIDVRDEKIPESFTQQ